MSFALAFSSTSRVPMSPSSKIPPRKWQLRDNTSGHKLVGYHTWRLFATIPEIFCQRMYLMGLFYNRTIFNHPIVKELFHDIQLTVGIRNSILSLKSIPHFLTIREPDICIHKVFIKNTYDAALEKVIGSIERTPFLWSELFGLPLCYMH
jgi:hypothetical protein